MTLDQLIAKLEAVRAEHGGDIETIVYGRQNAERPAEVRLVAAKWRQDDQPRRDAVALN